MLKKISFLDLPNCCRISNGTADVVVATDIGPRILHYSLSGGANVLGEYPDRAAQTAFGEWKPWGGHRLWAAPEHMPDTYSPDNAPIEFEPLGELSVHLVQPPDRMQLHKEMTVTLDAAGSARVEVRHKIINRSDSARVLAPWAITILRPGTAIIPLEPWRSHDEALLPAQPVVRWEFTDFTDPRWNFGRRYIRARTDSQLNEPQKIGLLNKRGWCAHLDAGTLFVKRFACVDGANYADHGCNNEVYVEGDYLELESLGPLQRLAPGEAVEHVEHWELFSNVQCGTSEDSVDEALKVLR